MSNQFNSTYWASFSPEIQALAQVESFSPERMAKAVELAISGKLIDPEIQARGANPWETMMLREAYGYTWVPSLLQPPVLIAPGLVVPGVAPYNAESFPAGSIKVSVDPADYKPFVTPEPVVVPTAVPAKPMFTLSQGPGRFSVLPGDSSPAGTHYSGIEGEFVKMVIASPFGSWAWWEAVK